MRYFRRSGPSILVKDSETLQRFVTGPVPPSDDNPDGVPGGRIAYDDSQEDQAAWATQMAATPGWYEVDFDFNPIFPEPEKLFDPSSRPAPEADKAPAGPVPVPARTFPPLGAGAQAPETPADEPES